MQQNFQQLILGLCAELNIDYQLLADNWIVQLKKNQLTRFLTGSRFDLNTSSTGKIIDDKAATFEILKEAKIPAVPHHAIFTPPIKFAKEILPLVIKPNCGYSGEDVHLCEDIETAIQISQKLLEKEKSVCYSPYFESDLEYRAFFLDGKVLLIYSKTKPKGSWKHNLSGGATPKIIQEDDPIYDKIKKIALRAGQALNARFVTIDILDTKTNGPMILEMNQAISTAILLEKIPSEKERIKDIYRQAMKAMFLL